VFGGDGHGPAFPDSGGRPSIITSDAEILKK